MGQNGRAFGQRISSHDRHNEWKLFVGQVPLEVRSNLKFTWAGLIRPVLAARRGGLCVEC